MNQSTSPPRAAGSRWTNKALWLVGLGLLANAAVILYTHGQPDLVLNRAAFAQGIPTGPMLGARGIYMMPAQLGPQAFGVYVMDIDSSTIAVYRANPDNAHLRLACVRSFRNDRFLEDFNNDSLSPSPKEVQKMVEDQRRRVEIENKTNQPTVDQTTRPDENKPDKP